MLLFSELLVSRQNYFFALNLIQLCLFYGIDCVSERNKGSRSLIDHSIVVVGSSEFEDQPAGSGGQPAGGWTDGISPHSIGLCPL